MSVPIKYLTQSTWPHAAIYVGSGVFPAREPWQMPLVLVLVLVEADLKDGIRSVTLAQYAHLNTPICRPVGLSKEDCKRVVDFVVGRIGHHYDLKNIFDLARYLFPLAPVPTRFRRRMSVLYQYDIVRYSVTIVLCSKAQYAGKGCSLLMYCNTDKLTEPGKIF